MSKVWFQAINIVHYEENGQTVTKHPGDWGQLGRQQARDELSKGNIRILKPESLRTVQDLTDCAILLRGGIQESQRTTLMTRYPGVPVEVYRGYPEHGRFLIWDMKANLRHDLIMTGFSLLTRWQAAIPLLNYDTLAASIGSEQERQETKAVIHDLRVPVYNPSVIFARQCRETERLFELWNGGNELSFLRALYQSRVVVNALPPSWVM